MVTNFPKIITKPLEVSKLQASEQKVGQSQSDCSKKWGNCMLANKKWAIRNRKVDNFRKLLQKHKNLPDVIKLPTKAI